MSTAKCKIKNTIAVILLLTFSLILLLLFLTSNFSQAYAVTSYDSIVSTLTSDGYKTTESLGDSDLLDPSQKNYKGHNNTNDFIVASTKWTDKKAGKAEIKLQAAAYETPEQDFTDPVYIFTECSYRGYTFNHAVNHIKNIVELFGSCRVIAIMDSSYRKGNYLETSTDDTTIRNNLQPYNAWRSGNHPNYLIYSGLKEYLFGSISTPATKENAKAYPAAIFVNIWMIVEIILIMLLQQQMLISGTIFVILMSINGIGIIVLQMAI